MAKEEKNGAIMVFDSQMLSSINKIRSYLLSKGINRQHVLKTIDEIKANNEDQDFFSSIKLCKKKRIGPARDENNRPLFYKKDMGILARGGFSYELSKRVLELDVKEFNKLIKII